MRIFSDDNVFYEVINLGRASAAGSIMSVIESTLARYEWSDKVGFSQAKEASVGVAGFGGKLQHEGEFAIPKRDTFESCLSLVKDRAQGKSGACLVFDNLEHIFSDSTLIKELAGLILLVDDDNYSGFCVKLVLVGTSNDIRGYIAKTANSNTITNRLSEVPEVGRLPPAKARDLVQRGLFNKLGYKILKNVTADGETFDENYVARTVSYYADLIPQYVQELGLHLAMRAEENNGILSYDCFDKARYDWVRESLVSELTVLEANLNSRSTKIGRKNQVIYALGRCKAHDFSAAAIEKIVREEFEKSCDGVALNIPQTLSELADSANPIIRKSPTGKTYRFVDPKLRIVIRLKVNKADGESISLRPFDESISL